MVKKQRKIYHVGIYDYMGFGYLEFYFSNLKLAEVYFNQLLEKAKGHKDTVKKEDLSYKNFDESPEIDVLKDKMKPKKIRNIIWAKWHRTSYESEEWEIYNDTIFLEEIKLDFVIDAKLK